MSDNLAYGCLMTAFTLTQSTQHSSRAAASCIDMTLKYVFENVLRASKDLILTVWWLLPAGAVSTRSWQY